MKNKIMSGIAVLISFAVIFGLFAFAGWGLSIVLNIGLVQAGLGKINFLAGMGILAGCNVIKAWLDW